MKRRGKTYSGAGPGQAGGILVHVASDGAGNYGDTARERADQGAVACVTDDRITMWQGAGVGDPVDDMSVIGDGQRARWKTPVVRGQNAHRSVGEAAQRGV